jgi:hypothetical protein
VYAINNGMQQTVLCAAIDVVKNRKPGIIFVDIQTSELQE